MTKKYEFVPGDEITIAPGRTVKRIRALVTIAALGVSPGSLGGYIEREEQLSHLGNAWVFGSAQVSGDARVFDNAQVSGDARVFGSAQVYDDADVSGNALVYSDADVSGNAWVSGNALVYGDAQVSGNAWVSGNARVFGSAQVSGNADVYGDAQVSGNAWVSGNAQVYSNASIFWASKVGRENGTLTVYMTKDGSLEVTCGCFRGSVDEFLAKSETEHDDRTHLEYRLLIEVAHSRILGRSAT